MKIRSDNSGDLPDFLVDATNVYRTNDYIVKQIIAMSLNAKTYDQLVSYDTFYLRTKERDKIYEYFLDFKTNIDGKRIRTAMSLRNYKN